MIFITKQAKFLSDYKKISGVDVEMANYMYEVRRTRDTNASKQLVIDFLVATIVTPLLVLFTLTLHRYMNEEWTQHSDMRWKILFLSSSMIIVSLAVCLYVTHRLGLSPFHQCNSTSPELEPVTSRTHLLHNTELPPSYESIVKINDLPPSYCSIFIIHEKDNQSGHGPPQKINLECSG